jgi:predicted dehydrogenase
MRFGLIGVGAVGRIRGTALAALPGSTLSAVHDLNLAAARELAGGAQVFESAESLFASDVCEAVVISTPPNTHESLAIAALESGKHVLVEKPMANTLDGCRRMLEASRRTGLVLTVGFNQRYFDAVKDLRGAVRSGAIGRLSYVRGFAGHTGLSEFGAPWMYDKDVMGGGALMDNGIHVLDLVHHIMGEVESVYGVVKDDIWNLDRSEDNAFAILRGRDGVIGSLNASWSEWKGYQTYIEAYGDKGMARAYYAPMTSTVITMDRPGGAPRVKRDFYVSAIIREKLRGWQSTAVRTFLQEFTDFIELTKNREGGGVIAQATDGYRSIEIANAVYRASETGQTVALAPRV